MKRIVYILLALLVLNGACAWNMLRSQKGNAVYFLDVGQADSELIFYDGASILIDAGRDVRASEELERILPQKRIDVLLITHNDTDHAGGAYRVLDRFDVGVVLAGSAKEGTWAALAEYARRQNVSLHVLDRGDSIAYKNMRLDTLWPDPLFDSKDDNERSLVLKLESKEYSAIFAGDITGHAERIVSQLYDMDADILKVAHHGSKLSSSDEFLRNVTPLISVIEVGKNSYGHPTEEALARLAGVSSAVLRTDEHGTLRVYERDGQIRAEAIRSVAK